MGEASLNCSSAFLKRPTYKECLPGEGNKGKFLLAGSGKRGVIFPVVNDLFLMRKLTFCPLYVIVSNMKRKNNGKKFENDPKDSRTTIEYLKEIVQSFCEERDWDQFHNPKDLAIGIVTEAAELLDIFRFKSEKESEFVLKSKKLKQIEEELADILFFILRFSQKYSIDLTTVLKEKIKLNERKYPKDKARGSNAKYSEINKT